MARRWAAAGAEVEMRAQKQARHGRRAGGRYDGQGRPPGRAVRLATIASAAAIGTLAALVIVAVPAPAAVTVPEGTTTIEATGTPDPVRSWGPTGGNALIVNDRIHRAGAWSPPIPIRYPESTLGDPAFQLVQQHGDVLLGWGRRGTTAGEGFLVDLTTGTSRWLPRPTTVTTSMRILGYYQEFAVWAPTTTGTGTPALVVQPFDGSATRNVPVAGYAPQLGGVLDISGDGRALVTTTTGLALVDLVAGTVAAVPGTTALARPSLGAILGSRVIWGETAASGAPAALTVRLCGQGRLTCRLLMTVPDGSRLLALTAGVAVAAPVAGGSVVSTVLWADLTTVHTSPTLPVPAVGGTPIPAISSVAGGLVAVTVAGNGVDSLNPSTFARTSLFTLPDVPGRFGPACNRLGLYGDDLPWLEPGQLIAADGILERRWNLGPGTAATFAGGPLFVRKYCSYSPVTLEFSGARSVRWEPRPPDGSPARLVFFDRSTQVAEQKIRSSWVKATLAAASGPYVAMALAAGMEEGPGVAIYNQDTFVRVLPGEIQAMWGPIVVTRGVTGTVAAPDPTDLYVWDVRTGALQRTIGCGTDTTRCEGPRLQGRYLAVQWKRPDADGGGYQLQVIDWMTGREALRRNRTALGTGGSPFARVELDGETLVWQEGAPGVAGRVLSRLLSGVPVTSSPVLVVSGARLLDAREGRVLWADSSTLAPLRLSPLPAAAGVARPGRVLATSGPSTLVLDAGTGWRLSADVDAAVATWRLSIRDAAGQVVHRTTGKAPHGDIRSTAWDGTSLLGGKVPPGTYRWELTGTTAAGDQVLGPLGSKTASGTVTVAVA